MDYIVMEYLQGQPLDQMIPPTGLRLNDVLRYSLQIADALSTAHTAGIVHRDLKPANIMITADGRVKVLDFGLAKLTAPSMIRDQDATKTVMDATSAGMILGTAAYMSPEQATGSAIDARSDIFSFGAMLHEMISGKKAFNAESGAALIAAVLRDDPARTGTPLDPVIARCLRKNPRDRFQTSAELKSALEGVTRGSKVEDAAAPSVAVLPFLNANRDDHEMEFLTDGITEDLINALSKLKGLRVPARSIVFQIKGQSLNAQEAGQKLQTGAVLEGTVRRAGQRLRVTVQLVNVADGFPLWSERYDFVMEDIFDIQDQISRAIVSKLEVQLGAARDNPIVRKATSNPQAYTHYQEGRYHWSKRSPESIARAMECYQKALTLDPEYALAHSGLADCFAVLGFYGAFPPWEVMPKAKAAARRAVDLDDQLAEAHASLGFVLAFHDWDWTGAEREFERAIALNPNLATVRVWYMYVLTILGRFDEAAIHAARAKELDPVTAVVRYALGYVLVSQRRYEEGLEELRAASELDRNQVTVNFILGLAAGASGATEEGLAAFRRFPGPWSLGGTGWLLAYAGRKDEAQKIVDQLAQASLQRYISGAWRAIIHTWLGNYDEALSLIEAECRDRSLVFPISVQFVLYDPIRSDPRFQAALKRMGIAPN
jgi:TolB-like protein/tetratricopeptide (TPR) repeat protein